MTTTGKEVTPKPKAEIAKYTANADLLGMAPDADIQDIKFAKIKIHQGTTTGRKGMVGDIYETTTMHTLVGPEENLVFMPITFYKRWFHNQQKTGETKPSPIGQSNFDDTRPNQFEWKVTEADGTVKRNVRTVCFFAMLEKDLEDPAAMPCLIMLYSSNFSGAGQQLITRYHALKKGGIEPWLTKFALSTEQSKKGPHQVYKVEPIVEGTRQALVSEKYFENLRGWATVILNMQKQGNLILKETELQDVVVEVPDEDHGKPASKPIDEKSLPY